MTTEDPYEVADDCHRCGRPAAFVDTSEEQERPICYTCGPASMVTRHEVDGADGKLFLIEWPTVEGPACYAVVHRGTNLPLSYAESYREAMHYANRVLRAWPDDAWMLTTFDRETKKRLMFTLCLGMSGEG